MVVKCKDWKIKTEKSDEKKVQRWKTREVGSESRVPEKE
jgi:hypothetical protein